jgi:RNA polymerase sigma-70 factor (ECF subfamily)
MLRMDRDDQAAIQAVLAGDKEAYGALVVRYSGRLFRVAFRITGNEADAEDVVQDCGALRVGQNERWQGG